MRKYLGLDLGVTSLGVAISDKTGLLVSPLTLIKFERENYGQAINKLLDLINENNITDVVLGLPKNMDGTLGFAAQRSFNFKKILEENGLNVYLEDERLTTVEALQILKNNGLKRINQQNKTDIVSAVLILESFLKRKKNEEKQIGN